MQNKAIVATTRRAHALDFLLRWLESAEFHQVASWSIEAVHTSIDAWYTRKQPHLYLLKR
jgi:hypothetical protein